jgi:hypothetical protein
VASGTWSVSNALPATVTYPDDSVALADLADMTASGFLGSDAGAGTVEEVTVAEAQVLLNVNTVRVHDVVIDAPEDADHHYLFAPPNAGVATSVYCRTDTGTVTIKICTEADLADNNCNTDKNLLGSTADTLVCDSDGQEDAALSAAEDDYAANEIHSLLVTATASSPTTVTIYVNGTVN